MTTTADVADSTVALDILKKTNEYLSVDECTLIADKAYDVKNIYITVHDVYHGDCVIPLNKRNTKNHAQHPCGAPIFDDGLAMHRDGKFSDNGRTRQKYCCPYKRTSHLHDCPCSHTCFHKDSKATGCTKYMTLPDDYRLSIQRDSIYHFNISVMERLLSGRCLFGMRTRIHCAFLICIADLFHSSLQFI